MKIKLNQLKIGMILDENVYREDLLVLSQGTTINRRHIDMLEKMNFSSVSIQLKPRESSDKADLKEKYKKTLEKFKNICYETSIGQVVLYDHVRDCLDPLMKDLEDNPEMAMKLWQIETADSYTYEHSVKVCMMTILLAKWLNVAMSEVKELGKAALLHDIGKCNVPNEILNKPDTLTPEEFSVMRTHSTLGYVLLSTGKVLNELVLKGILHHHERFDGKGYPAKLKGSQIPEYARIIAVVDVFDAMTSNRVYRDKMSPYHVIEIMHGGGGGSLDPEFTAVFLNHAIDFFVGMEVMLNTGETGTVHRNNHDIPYRPVVLVNGREIDLSKHLDIEIKSVVE